MNFHTPQELDVRNRKQNLVEQSPQEENETKIFLKNIVETTHVILGYGSLFLFRTIAFSMFEIHIINVSLFLIRRLGAHEFGNKSLLKSI